MIELGCVVGRMLGSVGEGGYDVDEFKGWSEDGRGELGEKEMKGMEKKMDDKGRMRKGIMGMVVEEGKKGKGVVIRW